MGKFTVEFTIEAESLGHATNRALVALYKGELDAEDVKVSAKGSSGEKFESVDTTNTGANNKIISQGGYIRGLAPGETILDKEQVKKMFQDGRKKILKEPHKDALS